MKYSLLTASLLALALSACQKEETPATAPATDAAPAVEAPAPEAAAPVVEAPAPEAAPEAPVDTPTPAPEASAETK